VHLDDLCISPRFFHCLLYVLQQALALSTTCSHYLDLHHLISPLEVNCSFSCCLILSLFYCLLPSRSESRIYNSSILANRKCEMAILILAYRNNTMIRSSIICSQSSKHKLFVLRIIG